MGRPDAAVTVVVPNYNGLGLIERTLDALRDQTRPAEEVLVVDNASSDGSAEALEARPDVTVIRRSANGGFGAAANEGLARCRTPNVAVLNSDARPQPDWLERLAAGPAGDDVWAWGSVLLSPDGAVESAGDTLRPSGQSRKLLTGVAVDRLPTEPYLVLAPPGAAPLMDAAHLRALGGWFEPYFLYFEDLDLAMRARLAGLRCYLVPAARVEHDLGGSSRSRPPWDHIARSSLWCFVRTHPQPTLRHLAALHRHELRAMRRRHGIPLWAWGKVKAVPGLPWRLRERRSIQGAAVELSWPIVEPAWATDPSALPADPGADHPGRVADED